MHTTFELKALERLFNDALKVATYSWPTADRGDVLCSEFEQEHDCLGEKYKNLQPDCVKPRKLLLEVGVGVGGQSAVQRALAVMKDGRTCCSPE